MIIRIWHGWTTPENAEDYQSLLTTTIVPGIMERGVEGLVGVEVLRAEGAAGAEIEFSTVMTFGDWDAVEAFAGPEPTASVVPAKALELLSRYDEHSRHYEMVASFPVD